MPCHAMAWCAHVHGQHDTNTMTMTDSQAQFVLYVLAWSNVFALGLYVTSLTTKYSGPYIAQTSFDTWLTFYPAIQGLEVAAGIVKDRGLINYMQSRHQPYMSVIRKLNLLLLSISFLGIVANSDLNILPKNFAHTFLGCSCLFVFTRRCLAHPHTPLRPSHSLHPLHPSHTPSHSRTLALRCSPAKMHGI